MSRHLLTCDRFNPGQPAEAEAVSLRTVMKAAQFRLDDGTLLVFDRQELIAALTDDNGDLRLRLAS